MARSSEKVVRQAYSKLDIVAICCAVMLSVACLARGAVYDAVVALAMLASLPVLWVALSNVGHVHTSLRAAVMIFSLTVIAILGLQYIASPTGDTAYLWQQVHSITGQDVSASVIADRSGFLQGIGRLLYYVSIFTIALCIGTSESSSRLFLHSLLLSGTICLGLTFFMATDDGVPTTTFYSYRHGFVNPNNAAAYLGIMLLVALAQAVRFFKLPVKNIYKELPQMLDSLNMTSILNGSFILFSVLLIVSCLLMTASRAGIFLALLCIILFFVMIVLKLNLSSRLRKVTVGIGGIVLCIILIWCFINFGQIITHKLSTDGINTNWRLDIFASVFPMIGDHKILGTGLGSFAGVFQQYRPQSLSSDGIIDKAHNSYLEFAAEMGLPALLVLLVTFGWLGYMLFQGVKGRKERYVVPALGLAVWLFVGLHSMVDFPLQIPGLFALFTALIAICVSQTDPRFGRPSSTPLSETKQSNNTRRVRSRKSGVSSSSSS